MKVRRTLVAIATAAVAGFVGGVVLPSSGDAAAAPTTYSYTVLGTDSHTLNPATVPYATVGGGVAAAITDNTDNGDDVFEVGLDLPVGAKIKSVAITHQSSYIQVPTSGSYVFGYADPVTQAGVAVFDVSPPVSPETHSATYTRTGNPITTVGAGRRYVLDWHYYARSASTVHPGTVNDVWYGATIKYTCVAPCHP